MNRQKQVDIVLLRSADRVVAVSPTPPWDRTGTNMSLSGFLPAVTPFFAILTSALSQPNFSCSVVRILQVLYFQWVFSKRKFQALFPTAH
jgi:hypothetical protein